MCGSMGLNGISVVILEYFAIVESTMVFGNNMYFIGFKFLSNRNGDLLVSDRTRGNDPHTNWRY